MSNTPAFRKTSRFMFWGFFLRFFTLDVWYFKVIEGILAIAFLYHGLSMLRKVNPTLHNAWLVSCWLMGTRLISCALDAAPAALFQVLFGILNFVLWIFLILWYFKGLEQLGITCNGVTIPQCHTVIVEYITVNCIGLLLLIAPMLVVLIVPIMLIVMVIMLVQIHRIHKQLWEFDPMSSMSECRYPALAVLGGYLCVNLCVIVSICYVVNTKETIVYEPWQISASARRDALVDKWLPAFIVESLSDEDVDALQDVEQFSITVSVGEYTVYQATGMTKDKNILHHLAFYQIPDPMTKGHCKMHGSLEERLPSMVRIKSKLVTLYDKSGVTFGYEDNDDYAFTLNKGENRRGYYYTAFLNEGMESKLYNYTVTFAYDKSWLQYPFDEFGLRLSMSRAWETIYNQRSIYQVDRFVSSLRFGDWSSQGKG